MNKKIIIVQGYLATGKSTFALKLSQSLNLPHLIKDTFKIALCEHINIADRAESSRFSTVTFDAMMYVVERIFEVGSPIIIEGNFVPSGIKKQDEANIIKQLIGKYNYKALTFQFVGDTDILHKRFNKREKSPKRGAVNTVGYEPSIDEFSKWCHNLDGFDVGGEIIKIDTTNFSANKLKFSVNKFDEYIDIAKKFIDV